GMPVELVPFIERRIKGRGSFSVSCVFPKPEEPGPPGDRPRSGYAYEVRINGTAYKAFVFGKWKDQTTVQEATIEGVVLGDAIALGDAPTPGEQLTAGEPVAASSPTTSGPNTLLYMIARFSDQTSDPIDDATALSQVAVISN